MKRILTCAVTGGAPTTGKHPGIPVSPEQIANSAIAAARAGASAVHIHVRDVLTGRGCMDLQSYREVVERIRASEVDVLINLTCGPGAWFFPSKEDPAVAGPGTNLCSALRRVEHVLELQPEICTLDFNTMWLHSGAFINIPDILREMARLIQPLRVVPELEVFDSGDVQLARELLDEGLLASPPLFQIVLGTKYGAVAAPEAMLYLRSLLPPGSRWAAFGVSSSAFPMLAQALLLGGNVRTGLEDTIYLEKGILAPDNASLVSKAIGIMRSLGFEPATPAEARHILGIAPRASAHA